MRKILFFVLILLVLVLGCTKTEVPAKDNPSSIAQEVKCTTDSDCVPKECCHATSCINQDYKKVCNLMCTQECAPNTIDCGKGSCSCIKGQCMATFEGVEPLGGNNTQMANPASTYCIDQGNQIEIRTDADGGQYGVCIFPDRTECEEWAYFRGECNKTAVPQKPITDAASIIGKVISIDGENSKIEVLNVTSYDADPRNQSIKLEKGTIQNFIFQWGTSKITVDMPPIGPSETDINLEGITIGDIINAEISYDYNEWRLYKYEVTN